MTVYTDSGNYDQVILQTLVNAYKAANPDIPLKLNVGPAGEISVRKVRLRLETGKMDDSFIPTVSVGQHKYGAPIGSAMGGGIHYNKAKLIPVIQTYGDSWSAQILILVDSFNLQAAVPTLAALYTSNRVKMSKVPAVKLADGLKYLINGQGAHYPMLSFVSADLDKLDPKLADNIGIFAEPGQSARVNGLTIWMPIGLFIPNSTKHLLTAENFISFAMSSAGLAAMNAAVVPRGPYLLKGAQLSGHVSQITVEMQKHVNANGKTALQGATAYDLDVTCESQRLGLPGWGQLPE